MELVGAVTIPDLTETMDGDWNWHNKISSIRLDFGLRSEVTFLFRCPQACIPFCIKGFRQRWTTGKSDLGLPFRVSLAD
jgi:hypothetical protein